MNDITDEMIDKGAAAISDLLRILGVNPDELIEHHDAPPVAAQLAELVLQAGLADRMVVDPRDPDLQHPLTNGERHVWAVDGWSVIADPGRVGIGTDPHGYGGGDLRIEPAKARQIAAALVAAADKAEEPAAGGGDR
jgi:hypothetical protein